MNDEVVEKYAENLEYELEEIDVETVEENPSISGTYIQFFL